MSDILITGAGGMIGRALLRELGEQAVATDVQPRADRAIELLDVTSDDPDKVIGAHRPRVVVHLAAVMGPGVPRDVAYRVDVEGTRKVLAACLAHGVQRLVVTSSGAAYGYHADNPVPLTEKCPLRGNPEFPYADHKRQVEEMLAEARRDHPALEQVVLRVGTVLGAGTDNQITALFHKPRLLAIRGSNSPFVFIWSRDLARILARSTGEGPPGIYNVAGDGALSVDDIARRLRKPVLRLPAGALRAALAVARPLGLSRYGPEQVRFLQYRPVLDNTALKKRFGYRPELSSAQVFDLWMREARL
ncbi:SDR family oxidoreductase [Lutimaribacter sp. EGI FJ00015]|uniref:SDR family oxidoreductase n=1 Tax=Lutimaribacter degradans TaxID=2945989 RepID=A0ACC5ZW45_9RHOB|nr:SDR family oxidoreductase [Lutimaribacter sp. EGI FJ00013]MCM2562276.1 SDR family oxidoreductase [Lutimaribacter sp. EGI FJ00013]MCO0613431.1 SDR family oxidoreductase [Lutimaribacter sp. EGI FJ00015]MCO0636405.1 SDR family oxidoreductase [Lutimaribacter sp. EGI FJ00014]